jgi:hypothetical protein
LTISKAQDNFWLLGEEGAVQAPRRAEPHWQDGAQWQEGDIRYTVNSSSELKHDVGAYYLNMTNVKTGEKATAVYNSDGTLADVRANQSWRPVPRQKQKADAAGMVRDSVRKAMRFWFK